MDASRPPTPGRAIAVVSGLTVLALAENVIAPWAPFYVLYAGLAVWIPWRAGSAPFAPLRAVTLRWWAFAVVGAVLLQALGGAVLQGAAAIGKGAGVSPEALAGPRWSVGAALDAMFQSAGARWRMPAGALGKLYLGFILLWAGTGEEILYRGYLHGTLRRKGGFATAAVVSALFFAVRHATQLALVEPYPLPAAAAWCGFAFLVGIALSAVYERTGSLTVPVLLHYVFNLIPTVPALLG